MVRYTRIQCVVILILNTLVCLLLSLTGSPVVSAMNSRALAASNTPFHIYLPSIAYSAADEILRLTNQLRAQNGCAPLTLSPALSAAANAHSADMAVNNFVGHIGTDGSTLGRRLDEVGYTFTLAAENVAAGYPTPRDVVQGWYNETPPNDGHRRNILNCDLKELGIGQAYNPSSTYRFYWTQDFGTQ